MTMPSKTTKPTVKLMNDGMHLRVEPKEFCLRDLTDRNNDPTCIQLSKGGVRSAQAMYRWVSENQAAVAGMRFNEVTDEMEKRGIKYHRFCAMD